MVDLLVNISVINSFQSFQGVSIIELKSSKNPFLNVAPSEGMWSEATAIFM